MSCPCWLAKMSGHYYLSGSGSVCSQIILWFQGLVRVWCSFWDVSCGNEEPIPWVWQHKGCAAFSENRSFSEVIETFWSIFSSKWKSKNFTRICDAAGLLSTTGRRGSWAADFTLYQSTFIYFTIGPTTQAPTMVPMPLPSMSAWIKEPGVRYVGCLVTFSRVRVFEFQRGWNWNLEGWQQQCLWPRYLENFTNLPIES